MKKIEKTAMLLMLLALSAGIGRVATTGGSSNAPETTAPSQTLVEKSLVPKTIGVAPQLEIFVYPNVGLSVGSPNVNGNRANVMKGMMNQSRVQDWHPADPTAWRPFDYLKWTFMMLSTNTNFKLWMGDPNPTGSFAQELGSRLLWSTAAFTRNSVPFQSRNLYFQIECSHPEIISPFGGNLVNAGTATEIRYSSTLIGKDYTGNGTPILYDNGESPTTPVKEFFYFGPRSFFPVGSQNDLEAGRNSALLPNFWLKYTVWHSLDGGLSRTAEKTVILTTVPKLQITRSVPQSVTVMILGQPGVAYQIQSTTSLTPPTTWTPASTGTLTEGGSVSSLLASSRQKFWRLQ